MPIYAYIHTHFCKYDKTHISVLRICLYVNMRIYGIFNMRITQYAYAWNGYYAYSMRILPGYHMIAHNMIVSGM